jgi:UDP-N-acetylglucosamine:LPS N-acetylglucosamine transferase
MKKRLKICAGASAGGHLNQLLALLDHSDNWPGKPDFYVTTLKVVANRLKERGSVYIIGEANRHHPLLGIMVFLRGLKIAFRERPDIVITTGSMPLAFFCLSSKLFGARIVWIDSIANIERLSVSGRFVRKFADVCLTQWPYLASPDGSVQYVGEIL